MTKIYYLILASIFIVPLSGLIPIKGADVWYSQYLGLMFVVLFGISLFLWGFNKYISLFTVVSFVSAIVAAMQHPRAILCMFQIYLCCLGMWAVSTLNYEQRKKTLKVLTWFTALQGFWIIIQNFNLDPIFNSHYMYLSSQIRTVDDTVGFSGSHNQIGLFFAMVAPLIMSMNIFLMPLVVIGLTLSTTSTAFVAAVVSCLGMSFMAKTKIYTILTIIASIVFAIIFYWKFETVSTSEFHNRKEVSFNSVKSAVTGRIKAKMINQDLEIKANPLIGFGLGNFTRISPLSQGDYLKVQQRYEHAHNDYVEAFFEMGWLGLISIILIIVDFFRQYAGAYKTKILNVCFWGIMAQMICALGIYTVQTAVSGMVLIILAGLFYGEVKEQERVYGTNTSLV